MKTKHNIQKLWQPSTLVSIGYLSSWQCVWLQALAYDCCTASQESVLYISLAREKIKLQNLKVQFLLNVYYFGTTVKLKNRNSNHHKLGTACRISVSVFRIAGEAYLGDSSSGSFIRLHPRSQLGYSHMKTYTGLKYLLPISPWLLVRGFISSSRALATVSLIFMTWQLAYLKESKREEKEVTHWPYSTR